MEYRKRERFRYQFPEQKHRRVPCGATKRSCPGILSSPSHFGEASYRIYTEHGLTLTSWTCNTGSLGEAPFRDSMEPRSVDNSATSAFAISTHHAPWLQQGPRIVTPFSFKTKSGRVIHVGRSSSADSDDLHIYRRPAIFPSSIPRTTRTCPAQIDHSHLDQPKSNLPRTRGSAGRICTFALLDGSKLPGGRP